MAFTRSKTWRDTSSASSCDGDALSGKLIGSPYWSVTLGNLRRFQPRTPAEPWIARGTTGTPDSSASRPTPAFGSPSRPVRERPPSQYMPTQPPRSSTAAAVMNASSS